MQVDTEAAADSCHFEFSSALAADAESSWGKTRNGRQQAPGPLPADCYYFSTGTAVGTPCEEKQHSTPEICEIISQPLRKHTRDVRRAQVLFSALPNFQARMKETFRKAGAPSQTTWLGWNTPGALRLPDLESDGKHQKLDTFFCRLVN